jgi:hypothetical protein
MPALRQAWKPMSQGTLNTNSTTSGTSSGPLPHAPTSANSPASGNSNPVNYASRRSTPPKQGLNYRLLLFIAVVGLPLVGVSWLLVRGLVTKGITWHGDYAEVDLKALGNFPFNASNGTSDDVPARWRALDGKKVELTGFMFSPQSAGGQGTEFQFVYNVSKCCFNGPPLVQERVYAHSRADMPIYSMYDCAKIVGILHVRVKRLKDGSIHSVFDMDVQHVEPWES